MAGITLSDTLIAGLIGLLAGALGSLIAPWVHWGIKKREIKLESRKMLLRDCREYTRGTFDHRKFIESPLYSSLKPHLSKSLVSQLEANADEIHIEITEGRGTGVNNFKPFLLDELSEIERKWKLV